MAFKNLLQNIRNADPTLEEWNLLMLRTSSYISQDEILVLNGSMHLFVANNLETIHNEQML